MTPKGKRSGGPRSAAGKMAVSQNALKTGVYSPSIILPNEDEAQYHELHAQFIRDFAPADIAESTLIHDLTVLVWKKLRVERIETAVLLKTLQASFKAGYQEFVELPGFPYAGGAHDALNIVRNESLVEIAAYLASFDIAERILEGGVSAAELTALLKKTPHLYQAFIVSAARLDQFETGPKEWVELTVDTGGEGNVPFVDQVCEDFLDADKSRLIYQWVHDHYDEVRESLSLHLESRLINAIQHNNFQRVHDDLSRAYSRTLAEFRRHRSWRCERDIVTVVPEPAAEVSTEAKAAKTKVMQRRS